MITGIHMYGLLENVKEDEKEILRAISETGIHRIEPCLDLASDECILPFWSVRKFEEMYQYIRELGLETVSCHILSDDIVRDADILIKLAEQYGIKQFVLKLPKDLSETKLQETAFAYRMAADMISHTGAVLLLHNRKADTQTMIAGRTAYEYMADICMGKVGMQVDTGWIAASGTDPVEFLSANRYRAGAVHFKDFAEPGVSDQDVYIGGGSIDNQLILQFVRAGGIPFFIDQDCYSDYRGDLKKSFDYLMDAGAQREHTVSFLNIYDTVTRKVKVIKKFGEGIEAPNWLHGSGDIIYNCKGRIYRFSPDTCESELIESGVAVNCNNDHVVSADENEIAVSSDYTTEDGSGSRIFILPLEGGEARLITKNAPSYLHGWSPDKKELAYCAFREHDGKNCVDIYTISADGGEETRLTSEGFNDGPEYSPDGKHIWFISTRTGLMQVYRMNRAGSDITQMTFEEQNNWFGHVSPDCRKVVNLSYRKGDLLSSEHLPNMRVELWMMNYDGSEREKIMEFFGGQGSINVNSWSADSRYFAFVSYEIER